jgi:hypothetical protein
MKKKNIGSSFDSWLREEGIYEEVTATAIKARTRPPSGSGHEREEIFEIRNGSTNADQPGRARTAA